MKLTRPLLAYPKESRSGSDRDLIGLHPDQIPFSTASNRLRISKEDEPDYTLLKQCQLGLDSRLRENDTIGCIS
ncbi:MAG: hypothetical protein PHY48_05725 [Candidatus Cloacimonetes bacterium]|nr:hypothetical protein [Candidatus Cloacimonadota bacterium]